MSRSLFGWDLPPGVTTRMIDEQCGDDRSALAEAIADALFAHLPGEDADRVWADLESAGLLEEVETVGDLERGIRRHFDPEDHRAGLVLDDVRELATRVLGE